jgi:hypothetical protein
MKAGQLCWDWLIERTGISSRQQPALRTGILLQRLLFVPSNIWLCYEMSYMHRTERGLIDHAKDWRGYRTDPQG